MLRSHLHLKSPRNMLLMQACQGRIKINCLLAFYLREWMFFSHLWFMQFTCTRLQRKQSVYTSKANRLGR